MTVVYACVAPFVRVEGRCVEDDNEATAIHKGHGFVPLPHPRQLFTTGTRMNVLKLAYFNVKQCYSPHMTGQ